MYPDSPTIHVRTQKQATPDAEGLHSRFSGMAPPVLESITSSPKRERRASLELRAIGLSSILHQVHTLQHDLARIESAIKLHMTAMRASSADVTAVKTVRPVIVPLPIPVKAHVGWRKMFCCARPMTLYAAL